MSEWVRNEIIHHLEELGFHTVSDKSSKVQIYTHKNYMTRVKVE